MWRRRLRERLVEAREKLKSLFNFVDSAIGIKVDLWMLYIKERLAQVGVNICIKIFFKVDRQSLKIVHFDVSIHLKQNLSLGLNISWLLSMIARDGAKRTF